MTVATAPDESSTTRRLAGRARATLHPGGGPAHPGTLREPGGRRRPLLVVAGACVVVTCAAAGAAVATRVAHRSAYLVAAAPIPLGATIDPAQLSTVAITPASGLDAIPAADAAQVVGRRTIAAIDPGALVVPGELTSGSPLPVGDALVGASLGAAQMPPGLGAGQRVLVVLSGTAGGAAPSATALPAGGGSTSSAPGSSSTAAPTGAPRRRPAPSAGAALGSLPAADPSPDGPSGEVMALATVTAVSAGGASATATAGATSTLVTLRLPQADAAAVTAASAAGDVSLAIVAPVPAPR